MSPDHANRATEVLAAIFHSAVDAIVVIDARGLIEAFNPAAERLFGYTETEQCRGDDDRIPHARSNRRGAGAWRV